MSTPARFRTLRVTLSKPHRYRRNRALTMGLTLAVLLVVPLSGLARLDLWQGHHMALGRPADLRVGLAAVLASIAAFYGVTFLINLAAGRMFCGFGCPVGQLGRFADAIDAFPRDRARRRRGWLELVGFALLLATSVALWWVAPGVVRDGRAGPVAVGAVLLVAALAVAHGRSWRWNFCRRFCPIGLYYSVVQSDAVVGLDFDPARTCTDCGTCATICPVALDPRHLDAETPSPGGLAFHGLPANVHCLHCGACVEICEHVIAKAGGTPALGLRRLHSHAP